MTPAMLVLLLAWGTIALVWIAAAAGAAPTVRRDPAWRQLAYALPMALFVLLLCFGVVPVFEARFVPDAPATFVAGTIVLAAGIAFAIWARAHLGRFWSGVVTLKEGHQLVRSGPYAIVRNPIYVGMILGFLGSAILLGRVGVLVLTLVLALSFLAKIRREERLLAERFGEAFAAYKRETRSLIPGVW